MNSKIKQFSEKGFIAMDNLLNKKKCNKLYSQLLKNRNWGPNLFRNQKDVIANPQFNKTNPGKNINNLAEKFDLDFIEKNEEIQNCLNSILGNNYEIMLKKFVVATPEKWVPKWLKNKVSKLLAANLGPYIKEQFRDVTYFRGIDYHMDQIDFPNADSDFVTLYVYLNDVLDSMSPLSVIEKSHIYGQTKFPHYLNHVDNEFINYGINSKNFKKFKRKKLVGSAGNVYIWTCLTLHGTHPQDINDTFRISLRYLIKKNKKIKKFYLIDKLTHGYFQLKATRDDLSLKNFKQKKFNKILK